MSDYTPGTKVLWTHRHHGGYRFTRYYEATVVKVNRKTVTIELTNTRTGKVDKRNVRPENLTSDFTGFHKGAR